MTLLNTVNVGGIDYRYLTVTAIGSCDTPAGTEIKQVSFTDDFQLVAGVSVAVRFTYANTYGDGSTTYPKLQVNGTNYPIKTSTGSYAASGAWVNTQTVTLMFDGTGFVIASSTVDVVQNGNMNPVTSNAVYTDRISRNNKQGTYGALGGANQASSQSIADLLNNELCGNGGMGGICGGSIITETSTLGVPTGWYNFLYIPHRGGRGGDNTEYGTLYLTSYLRDGTLYIVQRVAGTNYNANIYKADKTENVTQSYDNKLYLTYIKVGKIVTVHITCPDGYSEGSHVFNDLPKPVQGTSAGGVLLTWGYSINGYFIITNGQSTLTVVNQVNTSFEGHFTYVTED